jgi:activator of 2-hydroxyglutaryl-CoA dehydratase
MFENMGYNGYIPPQRGYYPQNNFNMPMQQPQTIQNVAQPVQPQLYSYFVKQAADLATPNIMPNTLYLGINSGQKEIYIRKMNNDGNIELETYTLLSGKKEKSELQAIVERLDSIEKKLAEIPVQRQTLTLKGKDNERGIKSNNE